MFKSKIAGVRAKLKHSFRMMSDGYIVLNYPEQLRKIQDWQKESHKPNADFETGTELVRGDKFCYWTADNGTNIDEQYPVVIDFEDDLMHLSQTLSEDDLVGLIKVAADDMRSGKCHFPFEDMVISAGTCETPTGLVLYDIIVRVRNVTKNYVIEPEESLDKMIEISMLHTIQDETNDFYQASCKPLIFELSEDEIILEQQLLWDDKVLDYIYFASNPDFMKDRNDSAKSSMMTILVLFLFFYRHQRVNYREVEIPIGIVRNRNKRNKKPYTNYYVSRIGDFTKNVYTESRPSENPSSGVAMHVRRGHYQLWPNHRKLPAHLQKRSWVPSCVVGDPRYGVIIRDYLMEMSEGGEVTKEKLQKEIKERELKHE